MIELLIIVTVAVGLAFLLAPIVDITRSNPKPADRDRD